MVFLTESLSGLMCGEDIEANSWEEAIEKCPKGFRVIGILIETIEVPEFQGFSLN